MTEQTEQNELYEFPANIRVAAASADHPALEGIENPFVRQCEISSTRRDAYFNSMDPHTTLANFAAGAAEGVAVLDSHDISKLGVGYSFTGEREVGEDGAVTVVSDWYTVPGIKFGGVHSYETTDDYIKAVEARLVRKISVGFYGGRYVCDICHQNYYSWDCPHIAGIDYEIQDEAGKRNVTATSTICDATLGEYSLVYAGATPGAALRKMEREIKEGRLEPDSVRLLENRYRINLPGKPLTVPGVDKSGRAATNPKRGKDMEFEKIFNEVRGVVAETGAPTEADGNELPLAEQVRWLAEQAAEVARLRPLADDGRAYRNDLITEALAEGVRAMGESFSQETYKATLEDASIDTIKRMRDDWAAIGNKRFNGGRQTVNEEEKQQPQARQLVPDEAYQA